MNKISLDFFQDDLEKKVKKMCTIIKPFNELEASFGSYDNPINLKKFYNLLKYLKFRSKKENLTLKSSTTLDMSYVYDSKSTSVYRMTFDGIGQINNFIESNSLLKNEKIFSKQIKIYINQDNKKTILINKIKTSDKFISLTEYDIRIKMSEENQIDFDILQTLSSLHDSERVNIGFRFKQRLSLTIESNEYYDIVIDLTDVKSTKFLTTINDVVSSYELEVDISFKKSISETILLELLGKFSRIIYDLEKFLQESSTLITKTESMAVIKALSKLAYDDENETYRDLPAMQSTSVEIQHVLDHIPGNYTVTDKADGDRYFLIILNDQCYLISNNLRVKKIIPYIQKEKISQYNNTVLDGEYLYIPKYKKFLFLTFDILFFQNKDVRSEDLLKNRLLLVAKTLKDVFEVELIIGSYQKEYDIDQLCDFHQINITNHLNQLNQHLANRNEYNQEINGKYFIFPMTVGTQYEIFTLSNIMWQSYVSNTKLQYPYMLDGLIYTGINQKYTKNTRDTTFKILKWKPEKKNSIDLYVKIERNPETNKTITAFDRTNSNVLETYLDEQKTTNIDFNDMTEYKVNAPVYQIFNLFVGYVKNNQEIPVLFQKDNDLHQAFIFLTNGYPRDIEGNIIQDSTVVEFAYDNVSDVDNKFRWVPLRTRFDKTESVAKYKRKYGNNVDIANRIWYSILNPVTLEDIILLGKIETNTQHVKLLKSKITNETMGVIRKDDEYYNLVTNLGKSLRHFHNWIKSNMIYSYCSKKTLMNLSKVAMTVLEIGVGRGGDLMKLYHAKVKSAVAIDVNEAGIISGSDGAMSRYEAMKKKMPGFPKITFIVADAGQKFDFDNQTRLLKSSEINAKLLKQTFGQDEYSNKFATFNIFNIQFVIHYLLKNIDTWNNFCSNVNKYLEIDGYILITTLDGVIVDQTFTDDHIYKDYITDDGQKEMLFDIVKKYSGNLDPSNLNPIENLGKQIDVHLPMFMAKGVYQTEYLVNPKFIISELKTKCNVRLVETELFQNLYYVYEDFFLNTAKYESKLETKKFFNNTKEFYDMKNPNTKSWFEFAKLNRYFIFQKLA